MAQRLADAVLQVTNQLNYVLFPIVVGADTSRRNDRLAEVLVQGTRLSLATIIPVAGSLALLADAVVVGWTGPRFAAAGLIVKILAMVVLVRVGSWTANTVLLGAGSHRLVAISNSITAAVNVALSVALIRWMGLPGVALATLVPVTVRARADCDSRCLRPSGHVADRVLRRGGLARGVAGARSCSAHSSSFAIRPRRRSSTRCSKARSPVCFYTILFVGIAIGQRDRTRYLGKLRSLAGWPQLEAA